MGSHRIIQDCIEKTQSNIDRAMKSFSQLSENQLNWKINMDSWSIGECLSHLANSNGLYIKKFYSIINSNSSGTDADFSYSQSISGKFITKGVDPSNLKKTKTFKPFYPGSSNIKVNISHDYVQTSKELISLAEKMKHLDLKKFKISSPVNIFIRMNLGDPLIFIPKHDERHMNQAERVKNHEGFPH